jgi:hypothetical protein
MLKLRVIILTLALSLPYTVFAQQPTKPLTNTDVIGMVKAGLASEVVVAKIKSSLCGFDTSPDVLEHLKKTGVPDAVILAMVEAPRETAKPQDTDNSIANAVYVKCNDAPIGIHSAANFASATVGTATCNEALTLVDSSDKLYWKVKTEQGAEGFVSSFALSREKSQNEVSQTPVQVQTPEPPRPPTAPAVPANMLRAVAWRAIPWATTSYYQQPGTLSTDCTGTGQWLGNLYQNNLSCTGSYTPSQSVPISWSHYTIYNLVQTSNSYLVLSCTRNWSWSKCSYFIPGNFFSYQYENGQILVAGQRSGKKKEESLKYDIVASQPITR